MEALAKNKMGDIVAQDFRTAAVFSKYGLDFCCGGQRSVEDAAAKKGVALEPLVTELEDVLNAKGGENIDFSAWPSDLLVSYIVKTHHRYVREKTPVLLAYLNKVARVHGERHPELIEVNRLFEECALDLGHHLEKEERILFPFIEALEESKSHQERPETPTFGTVKNPISMMVHEHEAEGDRFERIKELTNNYTVPDDACSTYRVSFDMLREFEQDLHKHIHLENNILFPKSIKLEESLH